MYGAAKSEFFYTLCVALAFICEGGNFSMFPVVTANVFGVQNGGQIMTWMFFACPIAAFSSMAISTAYPSRQDVGYIFNVSAFLTFLNLILLYFLDDTKMKKERSDEYVRRRERNDAADLEIVPCERREIDNDDQYQRRLAS